MGIRIGVLVVGVVFSSAIAAGAENWPEWRGPSGNGHAVGALPTEWSETQNIVWKTPLPKWGVSTPAVWGDAIFLTSQSEEGVLTALRLNAADGKIVWKREVGHADTKREAEKRSVQKFHKLHNNASPSPVTDGKTVVVHFGNGDLIALDFAGEVVWKRNLQDDYGPYSIWWGHANSPVLFGDTVISVCMQDTLEGAASFNGKPAANYVVAHELATGKLRWFTERKTIAQAEQCDSYTTPVFHKTTGAAPEIEMIIMGGNQLDAYEPTTGKLRWQIGGLSGGRLITGPVVAGDYVYATRGQKGELLCVKLEEAARKGPADPIAWRHKESTPDTCSPVVVDGRVFTIADSGIAQCLDAVTGKELWKERLPGDYKASPIVADGKIYFLNKAGLSTVVAAGETFKKVAENQLDDETLASPAAADGKLYIRGRDHLYCLGKK
jgi:outer membrane protein assembly factor BamB